ncbi:MAG: hypothetical protein O7A03_01235 [Alphaproteobacteria bacterium]|nr:hypothetical protein [Alphaproteobacteria bacterium]
MNTSEFCKPSIYISKGFAAFLGVDPENLRCHHKFEKNDIDQELGGNFAVDNRVVDEG